MSDHGHDTHDHGGHDDHGHGHDSHGHDDHGHDDHGHGHDDHGHGHEAWGDYNAKPPSPSTLPPVGALWLTVFGLALAALLSAIVAYSIRISERAQVVSDHSDHHEVHDSHDKKGGHGHVEKDAKH